MLSDFEPLHRHREIEERRRVVGPDIVKERIRIADFDLRAGAKREHWGKILAAPLIDELGLPR